MNRLLFKIKLVRKVLVSRAGKEDLGEKAGKVEGQTYSAGFLREVMGAMEAMGAMEVRTDANAAFSGCPRSLSCAS